MIEKLDLGLSMKYKYTELLSLIQKIKLIIKVDIKNTINNIIFNIKMVFQLEDYPFALKTGIEIEAKKREQLVDGVNKILDNGSDFLITKLFEDEDIMKDQQNCDLDKCLIQSDLTIERKKLKYLTMKINQKLFENISKLKFVIGYANYLGIPTLWMDFQGNIQQKLVAINELSQVIYQSRIKLIINVKLIDNDTWVRYIEFRSKVNHKLQIQLSLQILPNIPSNQKIIGPWISEKIQYFSLSSESFITNEKGYPVLSAVHQRLVNRFLKLKAYFIFKTTTITDKTKHYVQYICHLFKIIVQKMDQKQKHANNLLDYLLNPLQPYADHLESQTYQIFQMDNPKYDQYEIALDLAIQTINKNTPIIIYYIGAGRGAIISKVFAAAKSNKKKVFIYAIQKNPYPIQTLKQRIQTNKWTQNVKIVHTDIKNYQMPQKPDIFLSQLLGGFGDNQLSPQCLLWAQKNILPTTLCIPQDYVSHIRPTSYRQIHRSLSLQKRQCYYTVLMGSYYSPFETQKLWQFKHPLLSHDLNRQETLKFKAPHTIIVDGFIGYFTSTLFGNSFLSIRPSDHTIGSYSWFPIYFTFKQQLILKEAQAIEIEVKRINSGQSVWYQWKYFVYDQNNEKIKQSQIHNQKGKYSQIYL